MTVCAHTRIAWLLPRSPNQPWLCGTGSNEIQAFFFPCPTPQLLLQDPNSSGGSLTTLNHKETQ